MNASQALEDVALTFETPAHAILVRCEQSGLQLRLEGEQLKAKGNRDTIVAWQPMVQRHKPEIIALLSGQSLGPDSDDDRATLAADYDELTVCIIELCQLAGFSAEMQERMLMARQNLYPHLYAAECAYFRLQVIRARAGAYWNGDAERAGIERRSCTG